MHTKTTKMLLAICLSVAVAATDAFAQQAAAKTMRGRITRKDGTQIVGDILWRPQAKKYVVTQTRQGGQQITTDVMANEVDRVEVPKPEKLDAAINAVRSGKSSAAIPVLEAIVSQYAMLGWDEPAARYLAQAKLDAGDADAAIALCEGLIKAKPQAAYLGEMAPTYWQALLKKDKKAKLAELISKAISNGDRRASASALIMRGDMLMEQKEPLNALKDGYLRVVILYENVADVQPEALFKAAKAFEAISQNSNAEKMRSTIRQKYPKSDYAKKL